jgi:hypothetical protein
MRLIAMLFKDEEVNGIYRAHFIVYVGGAEATRFAVEFKAKPSQEKLAEKVGQVLEEIAKKLPLLPERLVIEKDVHT